GSLPLPLPGSLPLFSHLPCAPPEPLPFPADAAPPRLLSAPFPLAWLGAARTLALSGPWFALAWPGAPLPLFRLLPRLGKSLRRSTSISIGRAQRSYVGTKPRLSRWNSADPGLMPSSLATTPHPLPWLRSHSSTT